ncbi:hypothetical protein [Amycolatopsis sp. CA-230715]|uniref:hypothetical protein n=1 Tax=Amycolatopsis sp. CA-230715 TaxID=2745196 RepID=UPI001C037DB8|nr:hypothetical protein [Amycolatopsis sp. CA-230715]QWF81929.1 hypothetical protein HUW46_05364 [Amycolatopsis sp. CA-230715]
MPAGGSQLSTSKLALAVAAGNLVVCGAIGTTLLFVSTKDESGTAVAATSASMTVEATQLSQVPSSAASSSSSESPSSSASAPVSGPGGIATVLPAGWTAQPKDQYTAEARDPADSTRFVRFGISAPSTASIMAVHTAGEKDFIRRYPSYSRLRLEETPVRGNDGLVWEFEYIAAEGQRHVRVHYWRAGGTEYLVYASSKAEQWPSTEPILNAMLDHSTP